MTPKKVFFKIVNDYKKWVTVEVYHDCHPLADAWYHLDRNVIRVNLRTTFTWWYVTCLLHEIGHYLTMTKRQWDKWQELTSELNERDLCRHPLNRGLESDATYMAAALSEYYGILDKTKKHLERIEI